MSASTPNPVATRLDRPQPSGFAPFRQTPQSDPSAVASIWSRIRKDAVLLGAGNVAVVFMQLGFRSILVATLIPASYGRLSLVLAIYNSAWIIGSSGLPNSLARAIAIAGPGSDSAIVRLGLRAGAVPIAIASALVAIASALILGSPIAAGIGAVGLGSLVYSLLMMGILRGRGRMGLAACVMPIAGFAEVGLLAILWRSGLGVAPLSAFGVFALGNIVGLAASSWLVLRTSPRRTSDSASTEEVYDRDAPPTTGDIRRLSLWLALATGGVAILPLVVRSAATLDSYTVVAVIDVALVLFSVPQRLGTIIVLATTPYASRQVNRGKLDVMISRREHAIVILPFLIASAIVAFTPLVDSLFALLGKPTYAQSVSYLALALLAGPPRILYGLVEGVLIAHGEGRFLAVTAVSYTALASALIFASVALGSTTTAFVVFVGAFWLIYLRGLRRVTRLGKTPAAAG